MYSFNIFSILSLTVAEIYLLVTLYVYFRNPKVTVNKLFAFVGLTMAVWGLGEGMMRASLEPDTALFWARYVVGIGSTFHSAVLLHFWLVFSGRMAAFEKKLPAIIIYFPSAVFFILRVFYPDTLVNGVAKEYWGYSSIGTPIYLSFMLYLIVFTSIVVFLALKTSSQTTGKLKQQSRNIGFGVLFSVLAGLLTQVSRPLFNFPVPELTVISTIVFISLIAYAVSRYGLLVITSKVVAENIIATMDDYVIVIDKNTNIALVNNSILNKLGYKEGELLNKPISVLLSSDISSLTYEQLVSRFPLINYQAVVLAKNGDKVPISVSAAILREGETEVYGFVFVLRDMRKINELISNLQQKTQEQEASKKELEKSKTELEQRNAELETINKFAVGRELTMVELKNKIRELEERVQSAGKP